MKIFNDRFVVSLLVAVFAVSSIKAAPASDNAPIDVPMVQAADPVAAGQALIRRVIGMRARSFVVEIIPASDRGHHVFEIESADGKIVLRGDNGVSVASAFNHYLKHYANCHLSWCGDQLNLPDKLPAVTSKVRLETPHDYAVMFNYCTLNYTCSWWDWSRWERELDFLAMNGINTPLGMIGLEGVWYNTLIKNGFSDLEAREFLVGPAFNAWQWMTNIESHGGTVSKDWIVERVKLGQQWQARARELGMTPIRQGFSGYVPRLLKQKHPQAAIAKQPGWCGFEGSSQLDPTDPFFKVIGKSFMEESIRLFGDQGHLWAADPFHESSPPKQGEAYLNAVGTAIHSLMKEHDPKAVWVMQAWSIRKPITDSVPKGELLVLDLSGKRSDFWGHDFIKGQLHNFGGRINLHGDIRTITSNPFAVAVAKNPQCKGMGLFPEAIIQNPVFYDAVYDMIWRAEGTATNDWLDAYAHRRYGVDSPNFRKAWKILLESGPYGHEDSANQENSSMIAARPALVAKKSGPNQGFKIPYSPPNLIEAVELMLGESGRASSSSAYRYDVVDFTRQVLANYAQSLHKQIRLAYLQKDRKAFAAKTERFHQLLRDTDQLLATRSEFLLGKWLSDARARGTSPDEAELFAKNALQLVTLWGPAPMSDRTGKHAFIFDYSWREWSGLISHYYLPRWIKFHAMLEKSIDRGDYRDPSSQVHGREALCANAFYAELADWEIEFIVKPLVSLPSKPSGDSVATAKQMLEKYKSEILLAAKNESSLDTQIDQLMSPLAGNASFVGRWKSGEIPTSGKVVEWDATALIKEDGRYEVGFTYQSGGNRLDIEWVALLVNGTEIARDAHAGSTGNTAVANTYRLNTGGLVFNGQYTLKAMVKTAGGHDSNGVISLRKL